MITCGLCGQDMTPQNSKIMPEMFVCDACARVKFPEMVILETPVKSDAEQLRSLLVALLASDGHLVRCAFSGCNCGKVENYKVARGEATRWLHDHPEVPRV